MLAYGISDFVRLREEHFAYVDKTKFIEELEKDKYVTFLRPRRFGKSLFVSTLEAYYDTRFEARFEELFAGTCIGMYPTPRRNVYSVLKLDFSGILSKDMDRLRVDMYDSVARQLATFIEDHGLEGKVTLKVEDKPKDRYPSELLMAFFTDVRKFVSDHPIYILIDEYDHFSNGLLGSRTADSMHFDDGFVRVFYEVIKSATSDSVVSRIFVTGVIPVSLDSMTSGLGISVDATCELNYHDMAGFTDGETRDLIRTVFPDKPEAERKSLFTGLALHCRGYRFSEHADATLFNSEMVMHCLASMQDNGEAPEGILGDCEKIIDLLTFIPAPEPDPGQAAGCPRSPRSSTAASAQWLTCWTDRKLWQF